MGQDVAFRRCFPCYDEPSAKAKFTISVIAPSDRTVHSNMPKTKDTDKALDEVISSFFCLDEKKHWTSHFR